VRLLLASDLHYRLRQLDWVVDAAGDFDLVVLAGDHLDVSSPVDLDAQIAVALAYFSRLAERTRLVVCSGNHDLDARGPHDEKWASWIERARDVGAAVDGDLVEVGGWSFTVCPWWDGPATRALVDAQLAADAVRAVRPWAWIYHWPPPDSPVSVTRRGSYGDPELAAWIARHGPDLVLTGHVHESPFHEAGAFAARVGDTLVVNAGQQRGPVPTHVEIDTEADTVRWHSLLGVGEVALAVGAVR
jgi:Icc-related predicted phosphoesterase